MGSDSKAFESALRQARLASAAHLDALAAAQDAKALRLDHVRGLILSQLPEGHALTGQMILRLPPEDEARLLLDLTRSITIEADGRGFRLEEDGPHGRRVLLESQSASDIADEVVRQEAVTLVEAAQKAEPNRDGRAAEGENWGQAAFLFIAGAVFGATSLAAIAIYLKRLTI